MLPLAWPCAATFREPSSQLAGHHILAAGSRVHQSFERTCCALCGWRHLQNLATQVALESAPMPFSQCHGLKLLFGSGRKNVRRAWCWCQRLSRPESPAWRSSSESRWRQHLRRQGCKAAGDQLRHTKFQLRRDKGPSGLAHNKSWRHVKSFCRIAQREIWRRAFHIVCMLLDVYTQYIFVVKFAKQSGSSICVTKKTGRKVWQHVPPHGPRDHRHIGFFCGGYLIIPQPPMMAIEATCKGPGPRGIGGGLYHRPRLAPGQRAPWGQRVGPSGIRWWVSVVFPLDWNCSSIFQSWLWE